MSEEKQEELQEEAVEQTQEVKVEAVPEEPADDGPKAEILEDGTFKLDLSQGSKEPEVEQEPEPEVQPEPEVEEQFVGLEEVTEEQPVEEVKEQVEELEEQVEQALVEADAGVELPENIQKVVEFINETGGSLEDYVKLNQDFTSYDDKSLLREYYKQTKPHLDNDEISFLMEIGRAHV